MENSQTKIGSFNFERKAESTIQEGGKTENTKDSPLSKIVTDAVKISGDSTQGMVAQVVKNLVFNH
jgi:hypothetical protein